MLTPIFIVIGLLGFDALALWLREQWATVRPRLPVWFWHPVNWLMLLVVVALTLAALAGGAYVTLVDMIGNPS